MKKCILIGALAALMLFAFTACEPQATYKVPTGLTISTTKTAYLVGETLDVASFTGTVRYSDGSSDKLSGSELSLAFGESNTTGKIEANANTVTATYGGVTGTEVTVVSATTTVYGYEAKNAVITGVPEVVARSTSDGDEQDVVLENPTVTVDVNGESRTLAANEYVLSAKVDTSGTVGEDASVTFTLSVYGQLVTDITTTAKVEIGAYTAEVTDKVAKQLVVEVAKETPAKPYIARGLFDKSVVTVWTANAAGQKLENVTSDAEIKLTTPLTGITGLKDGVERFSETAGSNALTVTYDLVDEFGKITPLSNTTATITTRADYATAISGKKNTADALTGGASIAVSDFTFTVTSWKSGIQTDIENYLTSSYTTITSVQTGATWTADPANAPAATDAQQNITIEFSYAPTVNYTDLVSTVEVPATVAAKS